jgi:DNA processing protein
MLTLSDSTIPPLLQQIPNPPKQLFVRSNNFENLLKMPKIAIVGSRKVTPYGRTVTTKLAHDLASNGLVIVSGMALGIDALAHQAALDAKGYTIAILPSPVHTLYPATNSTLGMQIVAQNGAIISEYETMPEVFTKARFIERNRLVSGISDALLVTEAAAGSGTLHTANFARRQGKKIFVVPGNITSPNSAGTFELLQKGAIPVSSAADILKAMGLVHAEKNKISPKSEDPEEQKILDLIAEGISDGAHLLLSSHLGASIFSQKLTMLEIKGFIINVGNNHWALR